ncbi:MAG: ABC transporter ATP-binding protein [Ilumatobacter sp.]|uniref:ABC transporter ATP-binding protein n=1 Tax=Ilumatobacter sp. TaxID=1967498 RepID=UPI003C7359CB
MLSLHPRPFTLSFGGAAVFAMATVASSFAIRWVIDNVVLPRFDGGPNGAPGDGSVDTRTVAIGVAMIIGIGLVRAVGVVFRRAYASEGMWRVAETYTNQVVDRLVRQPVAWHRRHPDGDLVARAGVDTESTVSVIAPIPFASSTVLMIFVSTVWLFLTDIPLGIVALVVFPLVVVTNVVYERAVSEHYTRAQTQLGEFSAGVHESFEGVQLVKAYGAETRETDRLAVLADRVRASRVEAVARRSWFDALTDMIPALANIALVLLGAIRVESGDLTVGEFSSVIFLFTLLVLPLRLIGYALSELPRSMAAWDRIQAVVNEPVEPDPDSAIGRPAHGIGVHLDAVQFRHESSSDRTLVDIDLELAAGTITALVGPTGSGKSTLADLALGLISPTDGTVSLAPGARAIVFQEAFLVAGTVRDNVAFGSDVDDDAIWTALHLAAADDFVRDLPDALATVVGERGISLSGGQRQRVALARALVRTPAVLVLDDTTSALDPSTEAVILERLRTTLDATVLLIASRPSTIALADDVVFLAGGRIAGHGSHDELLDTVAEYREIVEAFEADRAGAS